MPTLHLLLAALRLRRLRRHHHAGGYTPHRVYDSQHKQWTDFESMAAELAKQDVIFLGEQHDDPSTHRMEAALLDAIARRRGNVVVSMEMFERDVQPVGDAYMAGKIDEATFLKTSRPWPNYMPPTTARCRVREGAWLACDRREHSAEAGERGVLEGHRRHLGPHRLDSPVWQRPSSTARPMMITSAASARR